jgi:hypothetical protein
VKRTIRVASHVHSAWSDDASWSLARIARVFALAGFDGVLICDHDRSMTEAKRRTIVTECRRLSGPSFILVPGIEYQDPDHMVHIPVYGDVPFLGASPDTTKVLKHAHGGGAVAVMAHPARRDAHMRFNDGWAPYLTGIEVWSRKYDGVTPNLWASETTARLGLTSFASLDFHGPRQLFPLAMEVDVPVLDGFEGIVDAIKLGLCRPTAFGWALDRFETGVLYRGSQQLERLRRRLAPAIRNWRDE